MRRSATLTHGISYIARALTEGVSNHIGTCAGTKYRFKVHILHSMLIATVFRSDAHGTVCNVEMDNDMLIAPCLKAVRSPAEIGRIVQLVRIAAPQAADVDSISTVSTPS